MCIQRPKHMAIFDPNKKSIIIVEGAQAVGKTTLTNSLRESILYSQLFRLSGNGLGADGVCQSIMAHKALLNCLKELEGCGLHAILDRSYLSELVYTIYNGPKALSFSDELDTQLKQLHEGYNVFLVVLTVNKEAMLERLVGRDKNNYSNSILFRVDNSIEQQTSYVKYANRMLDEKVVDNLLVLDTSELDSIEVTYNVMRWAGMLND